MTISFSLKILIRQPLLLLNLYGNIFSIRVDHSSDEESANSYVDDIGLQLYKPNRRSLYWIVEKEIQRAKLMK